VYAKDGKLAHELNEEIYWKKRKSTFDFDRRKGVGKNNEKEYRDQSRFYLPEF
jgi:hypothetical protein